eukprot:Rmarinus@m.1735
MGTQRSPKACDTEIVAWGEMLEDILELVFEKLPLSVENITDVSLVCKHWRKVAKDFGIVVLRVQQCTALLEKSFCQLNLWKNIRCLELDNTSYLLRDEGVRQLLCSLWNHSLKSLCLGYNAITHDGAGALSCYISQNSTLERLDLPHNFLGDAGIKVLSEALQVNKTLLEMNVSQNRFGANGARFLAAALRINKTLKALTICLNRIGDDGAGEIADALRHNYSLIAFKYCLPFPMYHLPFLHSASITFSSRDSRFHASILV